MYAFFNFMFTLLYSVGEVVRRRSHRLTRACRNKARVPRDLASTSLEPSGPSEASVALRKLHDRAPPAVRTECPTSDTMARRIATLLSGGVPTICEKFMAQGIALPVLLLRERGHCECAFKETKSKYVKAFPVYVFLSYSLCCAFFF
jgi:hypothetical protein